MKLSKRKVDRLIDEYNNFTYDELVNGLKCSANDCQNSPYSWVYNGNYNYWTMTPAGSHVAWNVANYGTIKNYYSDWGVSITVRPVINVYKSAIESSD